MPSVLILNGDTIAATKNGILPLLTKLSKAASTAIILPELTSASLISIRQLCDDNCGVFLNKKILLAVKNEEITLEGKRNLTEEL